jgi:hypothetical protein
MKKINCETENKQVFGKIEKNIPMSSSVHLAKEMEIGDSVLFENRKSAEKFAAFMRRQFKKASVRKQPDGTARVWYVADVRDLMLAKNK